MNLTQEQEAALYVQYTPLIYKTVHHLRRAMERRALRI